MPEDSIPMTLGEAADYLNALSEQVKIKHPKGTEEYEMVSEMYVRFFKLAALGGTEVFKGAHLLEFDKPLCKEAYEKFFEISKWVAENLPDITPVKNKLN